MNISLYNDFAFFAKTVFAEPLPFVRQTVKSDNADKQLTNAYKKFSFIYDFAPIPTFLFLDLVIELLKALFYINQYFVYVKLIIALLFLNF